MQRYGFECTVADARFIKPFDRELVLKFSGRKQFVIEDHSASGGVYSALAEALAPVKHEAVYSFAWQNDKVIPHGEVAVLKENFGMTAEAIAEKIAGIMKESC